MEQLLMGTIESYKNLFKKLLPRGRAWSRDPGTLLDQVLEGFAGEAQRVGAVIDRMPEEYDARTTIDYIDELEADYGIPNDCIDLDLSPFSTGFDTGFEQASLQSRRDAVHAMITAFPGGQNVQYYIDLAEAFGFTITIDQFTPFWAGFSTAGDACGPQDNIFFWRVNYFIDVDTPIPDDQLECLLNLFKPKHTTVFIQITGPGFDSGFSAGFDAIPSFELLGRLEGGFSQGFSTGFEVKHGGGFESGSFDNGFDKMR